MSTLPQQIDLDGRLHDVAPAHERLRLFAPAPAQLAGQTHLDTDHEEEHVTMQSDIERRAREETDPDYDPAAEEVETISIDCDPGGMSPTVYAVVYEGDKGAPFVDEVYVDADQAAARVAGIVADDPSAGGAWVEECALLDRKRGSQVLMDTGSPTSVTGTLPMQLVARIVSNLQGGDADADQALLAEVADALGVPYTLADERR